MTGTHLFICSFSFSAHLPPVGTLALPPVVIKLFLLASLGWHGVLTSTGKPSAVPRAPGPALMLHRSLARWAQHDPRGLWAWGLRVRAQQGPT